MYSITVSTRFWHLASSFPPFAQFKYKFFSMKREAISVEIEVNFAKMRLILEEKSGDVL